MRPDFNSTRMRRCKQRFDDIVVSIVGDFADLTDASCRATRRKTQNQISSFPGECLLIFAARRFFDCCGFRWLSEVIRS
ncbi:hypothetical protein RRG08_005904 [Elysia crispata]|uniref:Uncharacterized protein n=1 Tax=Elysia crispata TaxID=231223 RepID=A0AAE0Y4X5_9GAST|nr:hypothetical protein RRG08_005904 [Elysia crispata]